MKSETAGATDAGRKRVTALLSRYPHLSAAELEEVHHWFKRVATALDLGLLASDPDVEPQYRAYRSDHIDRFKLKDIVTIAAVLTVTIVVIAALVLQMS
jgi:hypothetical protein